VHDVVVAHQANQRMGTASTKTMGEVAGSGKKPWRQKGTGRARAGSFASPLWVGGGVVFGPKPRDFGKKVSRKTKQLALRKALTERLNAGDIVVVDDFKLGSPKTKGLCGRAQESLKSRALRWSWPQASSRTFAWPLAICRRSK
jgi:large subunit ribosomal protein L4